MAPQLLALAIITEATLPPVTTVWVQAAYSGPSKTWTVRLLPRSSFNGPIWFEGGDTVTVRDSRSTWWLVSAIEPTAVFTAELLAEE